MEARHQRVPGAKEMPTSTFSVPVTENVLDKEIDCTWGVHRERHVKTGTQRDAPRTLNSLLAQSRNTRTRGDNCRLRG